MKKIILALAILAVLPNAPVFADPPLIQPQTQNGVNFVSGGVGGDERNALKAVRAEYNLSLLFSVKGTGEYLSDVKVSIEDAKGVVCLQTKSDGPVLYAKLTAGHYNVTAEQNGHEINKNVVIGANNLAQLSFTWPQDRKD